MKEEEKSRLHKVFAIVKEYVWDQGGDGWGYILSRHYKAMADEFQVYENDIMHDTMRWFTDRRDGDDAIVFGNGQEVAIFMGMDGKPEYSDITVILPEP